MKILIIQENGRHDENRHLRECFCFQREFKKLGDDVDVWGLGHKSYEKLPDFNSYDLILNFENYDETGWVPNLSAYDSPVKFIRSIDAHCVGMGSFLKTFYEGKYDLILQATKDFVEQNSVWLPNSYDSTYIKKKDIEKKHFIGFCGSLLNRKPLLDHLAEKYDLKQDIWILGEEMINTINSYEIHFNINLANDINFRSFETIGCKTVLMTNYNPQYDELGFEDGKNCIFYKTINEIYEKLDYYQNHKSELKEIADAGYVLAEGHTHAKRATRIKELYRGLKA